MNTERQSPTKLEPRIAKLEVGLDRLTDDVRDLANVVRSQGAQQEQEIQKLIISVTQAAGPRKTDWALIISAVFLMLAIGSAVFWPLNQISQNNKTETQALSQKFEQHLALPMHPVGMARLDELEKRFDLDEKEMVSRISALDTKIQRETQLMTDLISARLLDLDTRIQKEFSLQEKALDSRISNLETFKKVQEQFDQQELRQWRLEAAHKKK
jgi:hypothetical protein